MGVPFNCSFRLCYRNIIFCNCVPFRLLTGPCSALWFVDVHIASVFCPLLANAVFRVLSAIGERSFASFQIRDGVANRTLLVSYCLSCGQTEQFTRSGGQLMRSAR